MNRVPTAFGRYPSPNRTAIACWARQPVQCAGNERGRRKGGEIVQNPGINSSNSGPSKPNPPINRRSGCPPVISPPRYAAARHDHQTTLAADVRDQRLVVEDQRSDGHEPSNHACRANRTRPVLAVSGAARS
jgi:hypothetical protein